MASTELRAAAQQALEAKQVPLRELLASVPADARLVIHDADGKGTRSIPVGRLCHEAAAALAEPVPVDLAALGIRANLDVDRICRMKPGDVAPRSLHPVYAAPALAQPVQEPDLSRCPKCNGPADNGHDREVPPNPYCCTKCMAEPVQEPDSPERRCGGPGCDGTCCQPVQEPATLPGPGLVMCPACCSQFDPALNGVEPVQEPVEPMAQAMQDAVVYGMGIFHGGKRIDPYSIYKKAEPAQEPVADRAAFERHAERLGYSVDPDTREGREGGYWSSHTQLMWLTWQAAMAQRPAQPVQEPVAYSEGRTLHWHDGKGVSDAQLFAAPPQRKPVEWDGRCMLGHCNSPAGCENSGECRAVERAHGIGGEG